ncbi:MAG TPA: replicative DNA helicase [Rugosimonospora sp.]|nr:replicative DNA helicase [Rugosimonospora sp.]
MDAARTPPSDIAAEQCVLGGMLLSKDAVADVVEILKPADFYRPAHATIYETILNLYGRGEPVDAITVAAALADAGDLVRVGGAPALHTCLQAVPTAANAGYYARIVAERAVLRRLIEAGTRIVQLGYGAAAGSGRDVDDIVDLAQQALYGATEHRVSEDLTALADVLQPALDEIEAVGSRGELLTGVPTGFADLDRLLSGLHPGQMIIIAGRPGLGKCFAGDTPITDAKSGATMPIAEFVHRGQSGQRLAVHTLTGDGQLAPVEPADFLANGVQPVYRLTTRAGRTVRATATHPFRLPSGWRQLRHLRPGDRLACAQPSPRRLIPAVSPRHAARLDLREAHAAVELVWDQVVSVEPAGVAEVFDLTVAGTHNFVAAGIVAHNSTAAMDFARSASIRHDLTSAIFSLEMSKVEIVMRLLAAEARVPLHVLRSGQLSDDDWAKLARRMGEIGEAPLFVDDTPNMTLIEIRAKARRLKQRHDLRLLVVDYLQLMTSPKRVENRQQEVSDLSRGLKLLAKEIDCPVVAVSQLNRGPEQRSDKRPQLSDLRESGCMSADTALWRADGGWSTFTELLDQGYAGVLVWSVDVGGRLVPRPLTNVFATGRRPTYRLHLAGRRTVDATGNHPFLTIGGWRRLDQLAVGDQIATAGPGRDLAHGTASPPGGTVIWDRVTEITPLGIQPVYDATVDGTHNFVANGIVAHNSIEQDADVVILLHRDDYYDQESPRAGEADMIVAKHRNGPTDTITVAAQLHLSRFVDLAVS